MCMVAKFVISYCSLFVHAAFKKDRQIMQKHNLEQFLHKFICHIVLFYHLPTPFF